MTKHVAKKWALLVSVLFSLHDAVMMTAFNAMHEKMQTLC